MASSLLSLSAGAAMCGMIYYAMASDMRARTNQVAASLAATSQHLADPTLLNPTPFQSVLSASQRTPPRASFATEVKARWNEDFEGAVHAVRTVEWTRLPAEAAEGVQSVVGLAGELGRKLAGRDP